jgi:hypothetical protein
VIAEAIDTAVSIGWAIVAWIILTAAFGTLALYTLLVTAWTVCRLAWRVGRAAWQAVTRGATEPSWRRGRLRARIHAHTRAKRHSEPTETHGYREAA